MQGMIQLVAALVLMATNAAFAAPAATLPAGAERAEQIAALPGKAWLLQEKKRLRLIGAANTEVARLELRSESLDLRADGDSLVALVLDQDRQQVQTLRVDATAGRLERLSTLPPQAFSVEALCLYRDPQQLLHAFLIGEDGQAEQWLLSGSEARKLRSLALPPQVSACRVDDASGQLLVAEGDFGVWAYPANAELKAERAPVALRAPYGPLKGGAQALALLPGGVAVLDGGGERLHLLRAEAGRWKAQAALTLAHPAEAIGLDLNVGAPAALQLKAPDTWRARSIAWRGTPGASNATLPIVLPQRQTDPVAQQGDAADDPAIWVNPAQPHDSRVLATNKKQGLLVYDLEGRERQFLATGRINNVDLRQRVKLGGQVLDLAVATQRDRRTLVVYQIAADGLVSERAQLATGLEEVYGACLYQPAAGGLEALVNDKDGRFHQIRLKLTGDQLAGEVVRRFKLASQPEGCVADEPSGQLFIGEEDRGIWVLNAAADAPAAPRLVMAVGEKLRADVEGMAIYRGGKTPYLIVSSQGNDSYVVLEALPPHRYRGAFRIGINAAAGIDAASETDGLDVSAANLGAPWQQGMLVVQDGHKRLPDGPQNFKYVPWAEIARALALE